MVHERQKSEPLGCAGSSGVWLAFTFTFGEVADFLFAVVVVLLPFFLVLAAAGRLLLDETEPDTSALLFICLMNLFLVASASGNWSIFSSMKAALLSTCCSSYLPPLASFI